MNDQFRPSHRTQALAKLKRGYAQLLDVSVRAFAVKGLVTGVTRRRESPDWADWLVPVWLMSMDGATICSVAPRFAEPVSKALKGLVFHDPLLPLTRQILEEACGDQRFWPVELFAYLRPNPPEPPSQTRIDLLATGDPHAKQVLGDFDGEVYAVRDDQGHILAHAGIKNRGLIQEIAVLTKEPHRNQGLGKALVAHATREILARGLMPVYSPNRMDNKSSYRVVNTLGFEKVGEMLMLMYRVPSWTGFAPHG